MLNKITTYLVLNLDKVLHASVSMVIMLYSTSLISLFAPFWAAALIGAFITALAGAGKELYDYYNPDTHSFEVRDLIADGIGLILGFIPLLLMAL